MSRGKYRAAVAVLVTAFVVTLLCLYGLLLKA